MTRVLAAMVSLAVATVLIASILSFAPPRAHAHGIYTGVTGKGGQLCCGDNDCSETIYREKGSDFEFLTRERHWVKIPQERITFLPIPGDRIDGPSNKAHLCYSIPSSAYAPGYALDPNANHFTSNDGEETINLYCAFIPPGGV